MLNSKAIVNKAIPFMSVYSKIYCYLDNDRAGDNALAAIKRELALKTIYMGNLYSGSKDLNDYLTHKK